MRKLIGQLLIVAALLFAQHAAYLHELAHAKYNLALAECDGGKTPVLGHGIDKCVAYGALAHSVSNVAIVPIVFGVNPKTVVPVLEIVPTRARIAFNSRAPPPLS